VASGKLAYWLYPKIFRPQKGDVAWMASPYCSGRAMGVCGYFTF
jgi:hypothetical protein